MDHVFVLYDRLTDSVWYPGEDENLLAVAGSEQGSSIPFLDEPSPVSLGEWLDRHPDSTVLLPSEADFARIQQYRSSAYLGVRFHDGEAGIVLGEVKPDSPAVAADLRTGDILRTFDGLEIDERSALRELLRDMRPGDTVELGIDRDGEMLTVEVTFGSPLEM